MATATAISQSLLSANAMLNLGMERALPVGPFALPQGPYFARSERGGNYRTPDLDRVLGGQRRGQSDPRSLATPGWVIPHFIARRPIVHAQVKPLENSGSNVFDAMTQLVASARQMLVAQPDRDLATSHTVSRATTRLSVTPPRVRLPLTRRATPHSQVSLVSSTPRAANNATHYPQVTISPAGVARGAAARNTGTTKIVNFSTEPSSQGALPRQTLNTLRVSLNQQVRVLAQRLNDNGVIADFTTVPRFARALTQVIDQRLSSLTDILNKTSALPLTTEEVQAALATFNELGLMSLFRQSASGNAADIKTESTQAQTSTLANFIVNLFLDPVLHTTLKGKLETYMMRQARLYFSSANAVVRIAAPHVPFVDARGRQLRKNESSFVTDEIEPEESPLVTAPTAGSGTNPDGGDQDQSQQEFAA